jgi:hypothetical protein
MTARYLSGARAALFPCAFLAACSAAWAQEPAGGSSGDPIRGAPQAPSPLAFLAGCWAEPGDGLREQFTAPTANLILGTSRYVRAGKVVQFEFHRIALEDGGATLTPYPNGKASVPFAADTLQDGYVVWANPEHDFPQRIIYDGREAGALTATIEGPRDGGTARTSWRMLRTDCER